MDEKDILEAIETVVSAYERKVEERDERAPMSTWLEAQLRAALLAKYLPN